MSARLTMNGCSVDRDEPHQFLDQAHGALNVLIALFDNGEEMGRGGPDVNPKLMRSALAGLETLLEEARRSLKVYDDLRVARIAELSATQPAGGTR